MTKRFTEIISTQRIVDNETGKEYYGLVDGGLFDLMNILAEENKQLRKDATTLIYSNQEYRKENEKLKKENQGIQDKVMRLLDYVEIKQCVTRTEIKKWWNGD